MEISAGAAHTNATLAVDKEFLARERARARRRRIGGRYAVAYLCLLPTVIVLVAVLLIPIVKTFLSAFSGINEIGQATGFDGLANFRYLFSDPVFPGIAVNTLIWTAVITIVATPVSVALAIVLNKRFRGRAIARALVFAPWAISFVYVAVIWQFILDPFYGQLNSLFHVLGFHTIGRAWLGTGATAFPAVMAVGVQLTLPFTTIVTLAGLQSIPVDVVEAARTDGASRMQVVRYITLPLIKPVLTVATVVNIIYIFNSFPIIWTMTQGGPGNQTDTVVTYLYKLAFDNSQFGEAAALSLISFVVLMIFSALYVRHVVREPSL
jgi:multiple sugar transport system permease protein